MTRLRTARFVSRLPLLFAGFCTAAVLLPAAHAHAQSGRRMMQELAKSDKDKTAEALLKHGDPSQCMVVVEPVPRRGFDIQSAKAIATDAMSALRARLGNRDAVVYEDTLVSLNDLRRRLGPHANLGPQEDKHAYLVAAITHAPHSIRITYKKSRKKRGGYVATLQCFDSATRRVTKKDGVRTTKLKKRARPVETKTVTGANMTAMREALETELATFCSAIKAPKPKAPKQTPDGPPGMRKPKPKKAWSPPPRR